MSSGSVRIDDARLSSVPGSNRPPEVRFRREYDELEAWITETPAHATLKGMFVESFLKSLDRTGHQRPTSARYISFKDYPLREVMRIMLDSVKTAWPQVPPREGLRLLGQAVYPTLADSTVGKVLFSVAGRSFKTALTLTGKAYGVSLNPGSANVTELTDKSAIVQLRDVWNFTDSYQVGVMEGAMEAYGVTGTVTPHITARRCDVDLHLAWEA